MSKVTFRVCGQGVGRSGWIAWFSQGKWWFESPKNLPRVPVVHDLTEAERRCPECGGTRAQISTERSEQLDYKPASLFVVEHVRCTYACPHCEGQVVTAGKPAQPIPKGLPGPGLLAHVITDKDVDHIPLHRQEGRLARQGVEISRSTLCDWMGSAAKLLEPLYNLMKTLILVSGTIHTDDTTVKVRDSERKIKRTGRLWFYGGDHTQRFNVFDFTMSRSRDGPRDFLKGYQGCLQADAFGGYDGIYTDGQVVEVGCNAHARRKFIEAEKTDLARATAALAFYRELHAIERAIKEEIAKTAPEDKADESERAAIRLRIRQEKAVPVLERFREWLEAQKPDALPKSPFGIAIGYVQNNWEALTRYTTLEHARRVEAGRRFFFGEDEEESPADSGWLKEFVRMISSSLVTDEATRKLGVRYQEEHGYWRITVYPLPDKAARDTIESSAVPPGFAWDIENLQSVFDCIEGLGWYAVPADGTESPYFWIEGEFQGHEVFLRVLPGEPDQVEPGEKCGVG